MNGKRYYLIDSILLFIITLIIYWPVAFHIFSLKNDSVVQYLPYRYHLSEAIQNGFFPFWSPYLFTGFPIHADMQGMTWNPIVLILSLFTTYNMSVLQLEVTIYLFLCGVGMYTLLKTFNYSRFTCLIGAVSYMSCGYIVGSASVIPWISSAAFLPFTLAALHCLLNAPSLFKSILFSLSLSLFFLCCYPGLFIYAGYIIVLILLAYFIAGLRKNPVEVKWSFLYLLLAGFLFLLICSPAIISYWEFLPYYARGSTIAYSRATSNLFPPFSSLSFLLPNTVSKPHPWIDTDISMRSNYVGLFIITFFIVTLTGMLSAKQKLILVLTAFSFLFSLGSVTPLHSWLYKTLPLINTFRHPATIRLFTSIGIIILSAHSLQGIAKRPDHKFIVKSINIVIGIAGLIWFICIYYFFKENIYENISSALKVSTPKEKLDKLSFATFAVTESIIQLLFIAALLFFITRKKLQLLSIFLLFIFNAILFAWIGEPFTFISQVKTAAVDQYIASFPKGYPLSSFRHSIEGNAYSSLENVSKYGYARFYNKRITIQDYEINPTFNTAYQTFLRSPSVRNFFANYPVAYLADTVVESPAKLPSDPTEQKIAILSNYSLPLHKDSVTKSTVTVQHLDPNHFTFVIQSPKAGFFTLFQEYNHNWKATINNKPIAIYKTNLAFMGMPVTEGKSIVQLAYKPVAVIFAMIISTCTIVLMFFLLFVLYLRNKNQHKTFLK